MSDDEITDFIAHNRTATLATTASSGAIHLVAMWYAVIDGEIWFETKAKSQKTVNLRRNPAVSVMVESGLTYDQLRGVAIEGTVEIYDDADTCLKTGISVWERYNGPYTDDLQPAVEQMMNKRVAIRVVPQRVRSWDHRKLGLPAIPLSGSTAEFLND